MIYEIAPVEVPHESILALRLHQQTLIQDYERIIKSSNGIKTSKIVELRKATANLEKRMLACQKAEKLLIQALKKEGIIDINYENE